MSTQKRRGLGRGLGALIPTAPEGDRPVDVFFPGGARPEENGHAGGAGGADDDGGGGAQSKVGATTSRSTSWDAALSSGRLAIRVSPGARVALVDGGVDAAVTESSGSGPADLGVIGDLLPVEGSTVVAAPAAASLPDPTPGSNAEAGGDAADSTTQDVDDVSRETAADARPAPDELMAADDLLPVPGATFAELPVESIRPNTRQPRTVFDETELDELVDSVREIGVLQPIVVRPDKTDSGSYELIMGERRWRATQLAGLETVPAIIRDTDDADMLRDALLENLHRAQLNPLEEAAAYRQLLDDFGCTHEELATRIARSRPQISNTLRLLKLPPLVQRRVAAGVLSAGHARALLSLADGAEIERLAQRIVSEGLSVRAVEEIVATMNAGETSTPRRAPRAGQRSVAVDDLAGRLSDLFETRVKVQVGKTKGRLTVEFASVEDLNRILGVMAPSDPGLLKS